LIKGGKYFEDQEEQRGEELVGPPDLANRGLVMADLGEVISISEAGKIPLIRI
jgi:hypothetical protein